MRFVEWDAEELLPAEWNVGQEARVFNPAILADGCGYILAYRAVLADGARRIGMCRLDGAFEVVRGSKVAWSDHVPTESWFADPRLYVLAGHTYIYWNSGWGEGQNEQFLQRLDPETLLPVGTLRRFTLVDGPRQQIEKNWVLYGHPPGRAVYLPRPLRLLRFDWPETTFRFEANQPGWDDGGFEQRYGLLRGGAPPVEDNDEYWCLAHVVGYEPEGYRYRPAVFRFRADGVVTARPREPLGLPNPYRCRRRLPRLNPYVGEVVYPCGMVRAGQGWSVSYGINDERCALAVLTLEELAASVEEVPG